MPCPCWCIRLTTRACIAVQDVRLARLVPATNRGEVLTALLKAGPSTLHVQFYLFIVACAFVSFFVLRRIGRNKATP